MSSKLLSADGAGPVERIVWKRVAQPVGGGAAEPGGLPTVEDSRAGELQARIADLESQMRRREEQAHDSGFRSGKAAGEEEAEARLDPVAARFARCIEELAGQRRRLRREAEEDVVKLALAIGRRVLYRELSIDPEALLGVVKAALKKLELREVERVRVNPADAPLIARHLDRIGMSGKVEVVTEPAFERGAVIFETARGALDASLETQLEEIQRGLSDRLRRGA